MPISHCSSRVRVQDDGGMIARFELDLMVVLQWLVRWIDISVPLMFIRIPYRVGVPVFRMVAVMDESEIDFDVVQKLQDRTTQAGAPRHPDLRPW